MTSESNWLWHTFTGSIDERWEQFGTSWNVEVLAGRSSHSLQAEAALPSEDGDQHDPCSETWCQDSWHTQESIPQECKGSLIFLFIFFEVLRPSITQYDYILLSHLASALRSYQLFWLILLHKRHRLQKVKYCYKSCTIAEYRSF